SRQQRAGEVGRFRLERAAFSREPALGQMIGADGRQSRVDPCAAGLIRLLLREPALGIDPSLKRSRTLTAVRAPVSGPPPRRTPLLNERHVLPLSPQIPVALLVPLRAVRCVWPIPCLARLARSRLLTDEGLAALRQRAPFDGSVFL